MVHSDIQSVAEIIQDAGGKIVGRTRLQKLAYFLKCAGLLERFNFSYKHYGPYSEELAQSARHADLLGLVGEEEIVADWGGRYSVYTVTGSTVASGNEIQEQIASIAEKANAIELELAATALFLAKDGTKDPWAETERRKPEKAVGDRMEKAKALYEKFREIETPIELPEIST